MRIGTAAAGAAAAALFLAGCSVPGTGVRAEGPARTESAPTPSPAPSSATPRRVDPVEILKNDPKVTSEVRKRLVPCAADEYPVDVSYGTLTGNDVPDVVINVLTCQDSFGIASYVYREQNPATPRPGGRERDNGDELPGTVSVDGRWYRNVFADDISPVYAEIIGGELEIKKQVYATGDKVCCPSGEEVITYRWREGAFSERAHIYNDYSKSAGGGHDEPSPSPRPAE
ncbi:hypothetical protein [Streptomyces albus]|uniref:hypothetical protein n=1 Tax=Streptomyces albus TaxID=1888 RepID=UPI00099D82DA|nr:hypothetical protein [Streptomyces albus]